MLPCGTRTLFAVYRAAGTKCGWPKKHDLLRVFLERPTGELKFPLTTSNTGKGVER